MRDQAGLTMLEILASLMLLSLALGIVGASIVRTEKSRAMRVAFSSLGHLIEEARLETVRRSSRIDLAAYAASAQRAGVEISFDGPALIHPSGACEQATGKISYRGKMANFALKAVTCELSWLS